MRRLTLALLLLALWLASPATGQIVVSGGGGSGAFADSARAAAIADSAKKAPGTVDAPSMGTDVIVQHTAGKDTIGLWSNLKLRPWKKIYVAEDHSSDKATIADANEKGIDPGYSDFGAFVYVRLHEMGETVWLLHGHYNNGKLGGYTFYVNGSAVPGVWYATSNVNAAFSFSSAKVDTTDWVSLFFYADRDAEKIYLYQDGSFLGSVSTTNWADSLLDGDTDYDVVYNNGNYGGAEIGVARLFNFGTNGAPFDPDAFARALARRPLATMTELGYPEYEDADWSEIVNNPDNEAALATIDANNGRRGSLSQSAAYARGGTYSMKYTGDGTSTGGHAAIITDTDGDEFDASRLYDFSVWVYLPSGQTTSQLSLAVEEWDGTTVTSTTLASTTITDQWVRLGGVHNWKLSGWSGGYVQLVVQTDNTAANTDSFYIDDFSIHRIGEVARWDFNDASSSTVFADKTSNNNDLTPYKSGSSTTAGNLQEEAYLNHFFSAKVGVDTVTADTTFSWNMRARRVYLENDDVPGTGTTDPLLYAYGDNVWAHDGDTGANTQLSPHLGADWVYNSWNERTGVRTFINMFDLVAVLEKLTGKKLLYHDTVAVRIPVEQAVDTVYVTVVDTVKHLTSKVRVLRPRRHVINVGGKWYRIDAAKINRPPAAYLKAIGMKPW